MNQRSGSEAAACIEKPLVAQVAHVSVVVQKLAVAASSSFGRDCFAHAALGQVLLAELGVQSRLVLGYAAWRVGRGDGDVLCHVPGVMSYGKDGAVYHAWLESDRWLIDLTTYQFRSKARQLDQADGNVTTVMWTPQFLLVERDRTQSLWQVQQAMQPGGVYYEARPELWRSLQPSLDMEPGLLAAARVVMANPHINVVGPNQVEPVRHRASQR